MLGWAFYCYSPASGNGPVSAYLKNGVEHKTWKPTAFPDKIILEHEVGRRPNGFLGLSLNDRTIIFLVILFDKTVSVG